MEKEKKMVMATSMTSTQSSTSDMKRSEPQKRAKPEKAARMLQPRCSNGHVASRMDKIEKYKKYEEAGYPPEVILDKLGFIGIKKECCRVIFSSTVDVEER